MSNASPQPDRGNTLGKASLVLGILSLILMFFVGSCVNIINNQGGNVRSVRPMVELFGGTFALVGAMAVGLGLGGLLARHRPKASAIMGLIFGLLALGIAAAVAKQIQ